VLSSSPDEAFTVTVLPDRSEVAVVGAGELDMSTVDALDRQVKELVDAGFDHVAIDLRQVTFIDSSGLRVLLALRNDAKRDGRTLTLVRPPRSAERVFELSGTRGLFDWRDR
jgi:anti-sigma B factor antagonist